MTKGREEASDYIRGFFFVLNFDIRISSFIRGFEFRTSNFLQGSTKLDPIHPRGTIHT